MEQIPITSSGGSTTVTNVLSYTSPMTVQSLNKNCIGIIISQAVFELKSQDEKYDEPNQMHVSGSPGSNEEISEVGSFGLEQDNIVDLNTRLNSTFLIAIDDTDTEKIIKVDNIHQLDESPLQAAGPNGIVYGLGLNKFGLPIETTTEPEVLQKPTNSASNVVAGETKLQRLLPTDDHSARQKIIKSNFKTLVKTFCHAYVMLDSFMSIVKDYSFHGEPEEKEYFLSLASSYGYHALVVVLLSLDTDVECRNINEDCTPLMKAASSGFVEIVELLLEYGAVVNTTNSDGRTPLMNACAGGHVETVKLLLKYGADVERFHGNVF